jgi:hypothetical protein
MASEHTAKPAIVSDEPALVVEQLAGRLSREIIDSVSENQARSMCARVALGYYLAATVAPLVWGLPR